MVAAVASKPGVTQRAIATMLEITDVTAGRLIDRLCTDGYLERRENPSDRRGYCIYLTPAAQPLLNQMDEIAKLHEVESFANLNDDDLAKLDELLTIIARNLAISQSQSELRIPTANDDSTG